MELETNTKDVRNKGKSSTKHPTSKNTIPVRKNQQSNTKRESKQKEYPAKHQKSPKTNKTKDQAAARNSQNQITTHKIAKNQTKRQSTPETRTATDPDPPIQKIINSPHYLSPKKIYI